MGLSDACSDFVHDVRARARELGKMVELYAQPPGDYDPEDIKALREAVKAAETDNPMERAAALAALIIMAEGTRAKLDSHILKWLRGETDE